MGSLNVDPRGKSSLSYLGKGGKVNQPGGGKAGGRGLGGGRPPSKSGPTANTVMILPLTGTAGYTNPVIVTSGLVPSLALSSVNGAAAQTSIYPQTVGSAYSFNGTEQYITTSAIDAALAQTGDFTLEWFMYATTFAAYLGSQNRYPLSLGDNASLTRSRPAFFFGATGFANPGKLAIYDGTTIQWGATAHVVNTWNHVAVCRSGTTLTMWLNGALDLTTTWAETWGHDKITLGRSGQISPGYFAGYLSQLRLSNVARYSAPFAVPPVPFV